MPRAGRLNREVRFDTKNSRKKHEKSTEYDTDRTFLELHRIYIYIYIYIYTGCNRRNGPDFGRVFLILNYTETPKTPISKVERLRR